MKKKKEDSGRSGSWLVLVLAASVLALSAFAAPPAEDSPGVVNVNTATLEQLQQLPGIGEARARAIVKMRKEKGGFRSVDELTAVPGVGERGLEKMRPYVSVEGKTTRGVR